MNHSLNTDCCLKLEPCPTVQNLRICGIVIFVMSPVDSLFCLFFFLQFLSYLCTQNLEKQHDRVQE